MLELFFGINSVKIRDAFYFYRYIIQNITFYRNHLNNTKTVATVASCVAVCVCAILQFSSTTHISNIFSI